MKDYRTQAALAEEIQKYNNSKVSASVGAIATGGGDDDGSVAPATSSSLAARLSDDQLEQLGAKLCEAIRQGRANLMHHHSLKNSRNLECINWEEQV